MKISGYVSLLFFSLFSISYSQTDISAQPASSKFVQRSFNPFFGSLALTVEGGGTFGTTDFDTKLDGFAGGAIEYLFNGNTQHVFGLKVFGSFGYLAGEYGNKKPSPLYPGTYRTQMIIGGAGLMYNYVFSRVYFPYFMLGVSHLWFDPMNSRGHRLPNNSADKYQRTSVNLNGEVGLKFFLAYNTTFNIGGRAHMNFNDNLDDVSRGTADDWFYSVFAGLSFYLSADKDSDMDGVVDSRDACANTPSGVTVAINGCPEDKDNDGVPDYLDRCPSTPAGARVDARGCPLDSDRDGVPDHMDKCSDTPKDVKVDAEGCPVDSDRDGVPDHMDKCPNTEAGIKVNESGCPADSDRDGVPDNIDKCPDTPAGVQVDATGCPPPPKEAPKEIVLSGKTTFESGKAVLQSSAFPELDKLVQMMKEFPESRWRIEGHTDSRGSARKNKALSLARARAVQNYFVGQGISSARFEIVGMGSQNPVADNATEEGREENRRVIIFRIN